MKEKQSYNIATNLQFFIIIHFYFRYKLINHYDKHPSMINHHQYPNPQQYGYVEHPPIRYNYHQPRSLHQPVATNDLYPIQQQSLQGNDLHCTYVLFNLFRLHKTCWKAQVLMCTFCFRMQVNLCNLLFCELSVNYGILSACQFATSGL